ncbi:hypothetical protein BGZ68_003301 [Mortierella alpina]|nr:hypothetical protein BGZ68_003301 [Mortierella alpina]
MAQELHWSLPQPCLKSNAPVAQDVVPDLESSIFDDLQSDSNETFIVWNIPLLSSKPMHCTPDTTSSPIPSTPLTQNSVLPPAFTPSSSTARSSQASTPFTVSTADPANGRTQDRVLLKPRSAEGYGKYPKQDVEQAAGTRQDASLSTRVSETTHSPAKDRLIMAATAEKLVQKLTSDIDYTFLTDFFLIYRLFITPAALLKLFMLRFEWALLDNTPERQIVRIRTFVALRHWLLNYFKFDFMESRSLRQTLSAFLQSLAKHPLVITSPRDQRIAKELRRYTQSLKKLHYRAKAQEKLERPSRIHGNSLRRSPIRRRSAKNREWSPEAISTASFHGTGTASSQRSSCISETAKRRSLQSTSATEELAVEFRSSDQSDEDDTTDEFSDDDLSDLSGSSEAESSADDSSFGQRPSEDDLTDLDDRDMQDEYVDSDADIREEQDYGFSDDHHQELRASMPHPSATCPPFGSFQSQCLTHSVVSSVPSRTAMRGALPSFKQGEHPHHRTSNHNSHRQSHQSSLVEQQTTRLKRHSRPLSAAVPSVPAVVHGPPLSTRSSLRSIEPYMNPPPRSVGSSEKRKTWSKYMSATVGHLSKMKRVFASSTGKTHRHSHSSSSIPSLGGGSRRGAASSAGQSRPSRCWQGNRSDSEGEKISHYLLGSCTGMSVLLSTSDARRLSIDHRYAAERGQQRDEAGSGWSSDDDYSHYEMTRRGSEQMNAPVDYMPELQPDQLDSLEPQQDPQACETSRQQIPYIPYVNGSFSAFDVDFELKTEEPAGVRRHTFAGSMEGGAKDKSVAANAILPTDPIARPAHVLRRTPRLDQNHRESWVTFSSTGSSVTAAALNGSCTTPSLPMQERGVDGVDQSAERLYNIQQPHGRQWANPASSALIGARPIRPLAGPGTGLNLDTAVANMSWKSHMRRATDPQLFHSLKPVAISPRKPQLPSIVLRYRSEMIAQQLCLIERDLLSKVEWYELLDAGWTKKAVSEAPTGRNEPMADSKSLSLGRRTRNSAKPALAVERHIIPRSERNPKTDDSPGIKRLVERFNLTCQWVTSEIVSTQDLEMRVKVVEKFIRIAQLMLGLQAHSVSRLSQTWARVRSQEMSVMHDLVEFTSPFHNWKHLREAMKCIADEWGGSSSGAGKESGTGLYLSDLVFNSELPSFVSPKREASATEAQKVKSLPPRSPLINIHKHRTTATIIKRVLTFRTIASRYPFQHEAEVQAELLSIQSLDPTEISQLSGLCEERA